MSETTSSTPVQAGDAIVATAQPVAPGNLVSGDSTPVTTSAAEVQTQGKTISLPTSAFAKLKAEAAEKGRKGALSEVEQKAKAFGFDSVDAMFKALETSRSGASVEVAETRTAQKQAQVQQQQTKQGGGREAVAAEALRIAKELERARKESEKASREARRYRQQLEEYQAESEMKEVLLRAGVREEVDYALSLMRKDIQSKLETDPELAAYSTDEFLRSLRTNKPFLFGESRVAATTGTGGEGPQARPAAPGQAASTIAQAEQFDARKASPEQLKARLAQLGVQYSRG
jgi:hypothetical protein